ncbi:hypothetical protein [Caldicoprobacter faecalis]|uniref:hypothetical protein n=1 Tax=Caldicoprobacter faecalis TaxID=937334 RepID=UPI0011601D2B|nr:hypothetical protein [Caldicoprobacter faecalis]
MVFLIKTGATVNLKELNIAAVLHAMVKKHLRIVYVPIAPMVKSFIKNPTMIPECLPLFHAIPRLLRINSKSEHRRNELIKDYLSLFYLECTFQKQYDEVCYGYLCCG